MDEGMAKERNPIRPIPLREDKENSKSVSLKQLVTTLRYPTFNSVNKELP